MQPKRAKGGKRAVAKEADKRKEPNKAFSWPLPSPARAVFSVGIQLLEPAGKRPRGAHEGHSINYWMFSSFNLPHLAIRALNKMPDQNAYNSITDVGWLFFQICHCRSYSHVCSDNLRRHVGWMVLYFALFCCNHFETLFFKEAILTEKGFPFITYIFKRTHLQS